MSNYLKILPGIYPSIPCAKQPKHNNGAAQNIAEQNRSMRLPALNFETCNVSFKIAARDPNHEKPSQIAKKQRELEKKLHIKALKKEEFMPETFRYTVHFKNPENGSILASKQIAKDPDDHVLFIYTYSDRSEGKTITIEGEKIKTKTKNDKPCLRLTYFIDGLHQVQETCDLSSIKKDKNGFFNIKNAQCKDRAFLENDEKGRVVKAHTYTTSRPFQYAEIKYKYLPSGNIAKMFNLYEKKFLGGDYEFKLAEEGVFQPE